MSNRFQTFGQSDGLVDALPPLELNRLQLGTRRFALEELEPETSQTILEAKDFWAVKNLSHILTLTSVPVYPLGCIRKCPKNEAVT
jgi:hypothetical protein